MRTFHLLVVKPAQKRVREVGVYPTLDEAKEQARKKFGDHTPCMIMESRVVWSNEEPGDDPASASTPN